MFKPGNYPEKRRSKSQSVIQLMSGYRVCFVSTWKQTVLDIISVDYPEKIRFKSGQVVNDIICIQRCTYSLHTIYLGAMWTKDSDVYNTNLYVKYDDKKF